MKIVYVCNEYPPAQHGGIGTFIHTIAHAFTEAGHTVTVVGWGEHATERDDAGVRVVTLGRGRIAKVSWLIDRIMLHRWLAGEVAAGRCDLIEIPEYEGPLPFPFTACPVVVRLHLSTTAIVRETGHRPRPGMYLTEYLTLRFHRRWIAVSDHALQLAIATFGLKPKETTTIYNPMALSHVGATVPAGLPDQFVLFTGSVSARKGAHNVAAAARIFLPRFPDLHLVYLGALLTESGIRADARIREIVGPELADRVHCYGRVDHATVTACMARARIFLFPSRLENNPMVVGEAMLSGVPVVTSTCGPFPEYLTENETGLMVPPDDPAALGAAVSRLLDAPEFARRMSIAAHRLVVERFSLAACKQASERFYRGSLDRDRKRPAVHPAARSQKREG
jgi:glycosyltransferase involved in cell wall biosynthesis